MRNLYRRTLRNLPNNLVLNEVEQDIINHWKYNYNAFSISQMCDRHNLSKKSCRRKLERFLLLDIIELVPCRKSE